MHQTDGTQGGGAAVRKWPCPQGRRCRVHQQETPNPQLLQGGGVGRNRGTSPAEPPRCSRGQRGALLSGGTEGVMGGVGPLGPFPPESQNPSSQAMPQAGGGILWATVHRNHPSLATRIHLTVKPHPEIPINPSAFTPNIE